MQLNHINFQVPLLNQALKKMKESDEAEYSCLQKYACNLSNHITIHVPQ